MFKKLKSQKGSAMAYILVVVMILTIMMGALITMTVSNYRLGLIKSGRNTAFYYADGAIDEALAEIEEMSHRAELEANKIIHDDEADFKSEVKWRDFENWIERNQLPDEEGAFDPTEEVDEDTVVLTAEEVSALYTEALNREFVKQYMKVLLKDYAVKTDYDLIKDDKFVETNTLELTCNNTTVLKDEYYGAIARVKFNPTGEADFKNIKINVQPSFLTEKNAVRLVLRSTGEHNIYNKQVEVALDMIPPRQEFVTVTTMVRKEMKTNDILENTLVAREDIICVGGQVESKGDVYALGTFVDGPTTSHFNKGGVIVGYGQHSDFLNLNTNSPINTAVQGKGQLDVLGDIKTASSVKLDYPQSSISTKYLSKTNDVGGKIYADSFVIDDKVDGTSTYLDSSMYLMDDLYIAGDDTTITLGDDDTFDPASMDDSLVMYLRGLDVDDASESSASTDVSSSIRIKGDTKNVSINLDSIYVPGVAYINVQRNAIENGDTVVKYYQTGESFTTGNNFFFYQEPSLNNEQRTQDTTYTYIDPSSGEEVSYSLVEFIDEKGDIQESAAYKTDHFLNRVIEEYEKDEAVRDMNIVPADDKEIMTIHSMKRDIPEGTADSEEYENNYALGVFLANKRIYNPNGLSISGTSYDGTIRRDTNLISDLRMYLLGHRDYLNRKTITSKDPDDAATELLDQYIDFTKTYKVINEGQLIVVEDSKDVYINVPASDIKNPGNAIIYDKSTKIKGLVATKGNIYVYNDDTSTPLTFDGTLIAGKSIVFYGNGKKIIKNYKDDPTYPVPASTASGIPIQSNATVYGTVSINNTLVEAFHTDKGRKLVVLTSDSGEYTRSILFNLALDVKDSDATYLDMQPKPTTVDVNTMSPPKLDASSKEENVKFYEVVYWKEI
jgi:hypothetical protein